MTITTAAQAQSPEEFFAGKTLRVVSSTGAGGTMDLYLLLFMKHAEKHLPEGTSLVLDHRTGGGGSIMANYIYNQARADGTEFGMPVPAIVSSTFTQPDATRYVPDEFTALGRLVDLPRVFVARTDSGITSFEDLRDAEGEITHGIMTVGTSLDQYMRIANEALGANFRAVAGYSGGGPTFLAMEQGEVQSTTAEPANLLANKWHLVESGDISVLGILGLEPVAGLEDYPNLLDLIDEDSPAYGKSLSVAQSAGIGLSLIAPPGVPEDRATYLREVFTATMTDPELLAEAEERSIPINYASGDWLQDLLGDAMNVDDDVRAWFASLVQ
ncbi:Bug family tripartite tricarboxylate transporter substrate binding protein [Sinisalibacter lacisalsi]|uniref:Tripartite tricarboxylate transporter substrate binding protein n=1 Tax=Sinisalibacter lacisalsi TaxID=1526570 RepID=A0ABQ1QRF5_9RHOB|nr:tripartite tricarboxylate transporter substrate-binding protein [Sinisalibacter lacisalsi]GGD42281.1 hypothetical protein GCM10011358_27660 [Sinisalibacter lacisalsi]